MKHWAIGFALCALAGCASYYEPAVVEDGLISNPKVGWGGYSIRIPDGLALIYPLPDDEVSERALAFREWYDKQANRYSGDYYNAFTERFLLENPERTFIISFLSETYELPVGWTMMNSVDATYFIQKLINRKKVVINDDHASSEQVEINGRPGWRVSGVSRPYFKKDGQVSDYEGYFIIGGLKEAFWIEGYGAPGTRAELRAAVRAMVESLDVKGLDQR